ncbi:adenylate kinase isoform X2 [Topomyia yanbarensis]|uniref:adenylate kinase isoform X2 n=1 Tax=Topomyia yanbarensis TaxID=2498891 RepID=UPI00273C8685|nr:adenylate kinase isoform X2 [Topomyia yanbarensis]XP_058832756.1 adenylate kinase isoform X2 [Topomyia yanbarensis]XP_058832757.1 adenylate kinase isoform X2 [Topomyia yanbarensis]
MDMDLMILLDQKRPENIAEFIADNLTDISNKYKSIAVSVKLNPNFQYEKFVKVCNRALRAPVIQIKRPGIRKGLKKLPDVLERFGLNNKNKIFIGTGDIDSERPLLKDFNVNRNIDVNGNELEADVTPNRWRTILPIVIDLKNTIQLMKSSPNHPIIKYVERIVFLGRPGSGKHRLARMVANRLDLVLVSAKEIVDRSRQVPNLFKKTLEIGLEDNMHTSELITTILEKRLLEPDCQRFGWVLVDFPNTAEDVENLFHLLLVPRKAIFLHTNERLCWKRKMSQKSTGQSPYTSHNKNLRESVLRAEFNYFDIHQPGLISALEKQKCILLDVDGNNKIEKLYKDIIKKLNVFVSDSQLK